MCRVVGPVTAKMHVLTVLCREKFPEEFLERKKESEEEFRALMGHYLLNASTPCAGLSAGGCRMS